MRGSVSRYLGLLSSTMRRFDEAEVHYQNALAMNERLGARPWLADTQNDYAQTLLARGNQGDPEQARNLLEAAQATYRALGMNSSRPTAHTQGSPVST